MAQNVFLDVGNTGIIKLMKYISGLLTVDKIFLKRIDAAG